MKSRKTATYADYQERALEFKVGDTVIPFFRGTIESSGRVVAVYPAIGMVDVEYPHGSTRYPVEEIQRVKNDLTWIDAPHSDSVPGAAGSVSVPGGPPDPKSEKKTGLPPQSQQKTSNSRRVAEAFVKKSLYWAQRDRKYRPNKSEKEGNTFTCPKCMEPTHLKKCIYKRREGLSERLLGCPNCLFLIKEEDLCGE